MIFRVQVILRLILGLLTDFTVAAALLPQPNPRQAAVNWATMQCSPDPNAILPTPSYGDVNGSFTVCAQNLIKAPPQVVYDAIVDFHSYPAWNTFTYNVSGLPANVTSTPADVYVGMPMALHSTGVVPLINTTDDLVVSVLQNDPNKGYMMPAWLSNTTFFGVLAKTERVHVLTPAEGGGTRYVAFQTFFKDPLYLDKVEYLLKGNLQNGFALQGDDLRVYAESFGK